jgi:hypothetical protein
MWMVEQVVLIKKGEFTMRFAARVVEIILDSPQPQEVGRPKTRVLIVIWQYLSLI